MLGQFKCICHITHYRYLVKFLFKAKHTSAHANLNSIKHKELLEEFIKSPTCSNSCSLNPCTLYSLGSKINWLSFYNMCQHRGRHHSSWFSGIFLNFPALCFIAGTICFIVQRQELHSAQRLITYCLLHGISLTEAAYMWSHGVLSEKARRATDFTEFLDIFISWGLLGGRNNRLGSCSKSLM